MSVGIVPGGHNPMSGLLRIALPIIGGRHWLGGITYIESLVRTWRSLPVKNELFLVIRPHDLPHLSLHNEIIGNCDGVALIGDASQVIGRLPSTCRTILLQSGQELNRHVDFYYPVLSDVLPGVCSASWIPDFQHVHLPEFFSEAEIRARNECFARIAEHAKMVVFSSQDALRDFQRLFPASSAETRILHFHTQVSPSVFEQNPVSIQEYYQLPDRFLICCNQFWKHKNHLLLFEALAGLRDCGVKIPLVCTGSLEDYRFADYQRSVLDALAAKGLMESVYLLGTIPREHQLQLIRGAVALVQPSLFEGWSTVVEDGRALGKPQLLSDLAAHREQSPPQATCFDRHSAADLMEKLHAFWSAYGAGPDFAAEAQARETNERNQRAFAQNLQTLADDTIRLWNTDSLPRALPSTILSPQRLLKQTLS